MKQTSFAALAVALHIALAACAGGDLDAPSPRDPSSPRAPVAPFDPGMNPLGAGLSKPPPSTGDGMPSGHDHGGGAPMDMPMPSDSPAPRTMPMPSGSTAPKPPPPGAGEKTR